MKMEGFPKKLKNLGMGALAMISSVSGKAESANIKNLDVTAKKEISFSTKEKIMDSSNTFDLSKERGGLENKDYRIDTIEVTEKNGQKFLLLKLTKAQGEYSSYQEVIDAVKNINPDIILLSSTETQDLLNENKQMIPKKYYYISLGNDITGSAIDTKASRDLRGKYNSYKFDDRGNLLVAGTSSPADNEYLFTAKIKSDKSNKDLASVK